MGRPCFCQLRYKLLCEIVTFCTVLGAVVAKTAICVESNGNDISYCHVCVVGLLQYSTRTPNSMTL